MKLSLRLTLTAAIAVILCAGFGMVYKIAAQNRGAAPAPAAPTGTKKAGEVFKNVTTSTLKELSVDDFIAAMGVMAAGSAMTARTAILAPGRIRWILRSIRFTRRERHAVWWRWSPPSTARTSAEHNA